MRVEYWNYANVKPDGTFEDDPEHKHGSVCPEPKMDTSGDHHLQTRSTVEAGLWLSVSTGRLPDGTMHGITLFFESEAEMNAFEQLPKAELDWNGGKSS